MKIYVYTIHSIYYILIYFILLLLLLLLNITIIKYLLNIFITLSSINCPIISHHISMYFCSFPPTCQKRLHFGTAWVAPRPRSAGTRPKAKSVKGQTAAKRAGGKPVSKVPLPTFCWNRGWKSWMFIEVFGGTVYFMFIFSIQSQTAWWNCLKHVGDTSESYDFQCSLLEWLAVTWEIILYNNMTHSLLVAQDPGSRPDVPAIWQHPGSTKNDPGCDRPRRGCPSCAWDKSASKGWNSLELRKIRYPKISEMGSRWHLSG